MRQSLRPSGELITEGGHARNENVSILSRRKDIDGIPIAEILEVQHAMRVRMAGWKCAALPEVKVQHDATATSNPDSIERINRGVVAFVNKWNCYFNGANFNYHSPNVTRWEDWPPNALYLEEYWRARMPELNTSPEVKKIEGREYDLIRVPRFKDFYRGRII